jgi:hypothetical protein
MNWKGYGRSELRYCSRIYLEELGETVDSGEKSGKHQDS